MIWQPLHQIYHVVLAITVRKILCYDGQLRYGQVRSSQRIERAIYEKLAISTLLGLPADYGTWTMVKKIQGVS